jgi:hypothetical protein
LWQETYWMSAYEPLQVSLGTKSREAYLEDTLGYYQTTMVMLNELPQGSKVLMLWEPRGLYAPDHALPDIWVDRWVTDLREKESAQAVLSGWRAQGYTHLLVFERGFMFILPQPDGPPSAQWTEFEALQALLPEPVDLGGTYMFYPLQ